MPNDNPDAVQPNPDPVQPVSKRHLSWRSVAAVTLISGTGVAFLVLALAKTHVKVGEKNKEARFTPPATATSAPDHSVIDLISGTIDGKAVFSMSLEEIIGWLGRPSTLSTPHIRGQGAYAAYQSKGLAFLFKAADSDPRQPCQAFVIFLAATHNASDGGPFEMFRGTLSRGVAEGWKAKDVMKSFADCNPYDANLALLSNLSDEVNRKPIKRRRKPSEALPSQTRIRIIKPTHVVEFQYEENTKLVEQILVVGR